MSTTYKVLESDTDFLVAALSQARVTVFEPTVIWSTASLIMVERYKSGALKVLKSLMRTIDVESLNLDWYLLSIHTK
ncbi:hypothetical protein D3C75_400060 [compost metagenome]